MSTGLLPSFSVAPLLLMCSWWSSTSSSDTAFATFSSLLMVGEGRTNGTLRLCPPAVNWLRWREL